MYSNFLKFVFFKCVSCNYENEVAWVRWMVNNYKISKPSFIIKRDTFKFLQNFPLSEMCVRCNLLPVKLLIMTSEQ